MRRFDSARSRHLIKLTVQSAMSSRHVRVTTVANLIERRDRAPHPVLPGTVPLGDGAHRQPSWRRPARRARSAHGKAGGPWRYSRWPLPGGRAVPSLTCGHGAALDPITRGLGTSTRSLATVRTTRVGADLDRRHFRCEPWRQWGRRRVSAAALFRAMAAKLIRALLAGRAAGDTIVLQDD